MTTPSIVRLVTCGSVDDGKSTLIGRLLVETDSVPHDTLDATKKTRRPGSIIPAGEIDFSLLTDGLEAEREQGITIDVAYRSMSLLDGRRLIIADAPGHEQYTRNMAVAASRADIALVLVDATRGIRPQTLRHLTICSLMGVKKIIVVINKMDVSGFDKALFNSLVAELTLATTRLALNEVFFVPVSALEGDNVTFKSDRISWYKGNSVLEEVQEWRDTSSDSAHARLSVQLINRADNFRGVSGTISQGRFKVGEEVTVLPSERRAKLARIVTFGGDLKEARSGDAITMVLEPDIDVTRGDYIEHAEFYTQPADRFAANLVWIDEEELVHSRSYYLVNGSGMVPATITNIKYRFDVIDGSHQSARTLAMNEIGLVEIATDAPIPLTTYSDNRNSGNFVLVDRVTFNTVGAGMIVHTLRRATNITKHDYEVDKTARAKQKGQRAKLIWLTGLSGSGKSTIANALEKRLFESGVHSYVLDGDNLRLGLNKDLGFTKEDRAENVRRVSEVGKLMVDAGLVVIVALVSPFKVDRDHAREQFGSDEFIEVWVKTPAEICAQRDPKGLYKKAKSGALPNLTGVGQDYEAPTSAELVLDGTEDVAINVEKLIKTIL
ncbi:MAG: adenylyl-sulfate kinase [Actinomycetota bacterium]